MNGLGDRIRCLRTALVSEPREVIITTELDAENKLVIDPVGGRVKEVPGNDR